MNKIPDHILDLLILKSDFYNCTDFIQHDPIQIPHAFSIKEDIEIAGLLTATIAWGNRTSIIKNAKSLMARMDDAPFQFIQHSNEKEIYKLSDFVHRTFNGDDLSGFLFSLKIIYKDYGGLESVFNKGYSLNNSIESALIHFRKVFTVNIEMKRTGKHVSDVSKGSSAKRLNMFLRWMVRNDHKGVDFGLWRKIPSSALMIPLDVHVGNVSRKLGLLNRKQNDWKSVIELTDVLKKIDNKDPVKFDFALFGMGVEKTL